MTPGDLDGDDWDQEAALAAFMADIESGYDLPAGPEPDEADWPPPGQPEGPDAGSLPRAAAGPGPQRGGSGFASGGVLDAALPGPALAGSADTAAGPGRDYAGLDDDQLIGVLGAWQRNEAWAAAGKLSAVAELIRRRPAEPSGAPGTADSPPPGPGTIPPAWISGNGSAAGNGTGGNGSAAGSGAGGNGPGISAGGIPVGYGKFCADELTVALAISRYAAERMLALAHDLATRLPCTARALHAGVIDAYKAQIIAEATRPLDDTAAATADAAVLPTVAGKTPGQIRAAIARAVLQADPAAARRRREQAQRDARVELWREDAGTAVLRGSGLPPDEALAADQRISDRAQELKTAGIPGTTDQLRARAYLDTLLGQNTITATRQHSAGTAGQDPRDPEPAGTGSTRTGTGAPPSGTGTPGAGRPAAGVTGQQTGPAARINLTIPLATLLGLAERPGEATGLGPLDPDLARAMATTAATNPATTWCLTITDPDGHPTAHGCAHPTRPPRTQHRPRRDSGPARPAPGPPSPRTGPPGPPGRYGTWRLRPVPSGPDLTIDLEPIAVTDCDHRHHTSAHDPSGKLRHLIHIRDGECTYPPCRRAARRCDFEHATPWERGGWTCACNAGARCRHHHHAKQAPGWQLTQHQPGYHTWITPSGRSYTTGPTSYPI